MGEENNKKLLAVFFKILLIILILTGAYFAWIALEKNKPEVQKRMRVSFTPVVEVQEIWQQNHQTEISVLGKSKAYQESTIYPQVSGDILEINPNFSMGGILKKGDFLVKVDQADYILALQEADANLIKADSELALEQGEQAIAKHGWDSLKLENTTDFEMNLALRKPQLKKLEAAREQAKVAVDKAKLNLSRTIINVPFDSVVIEKKAAIGNYISPSRDLVTLVDLEAFYIQVSMPIEKMFSLQLPGAKAKIITNDGRVFSGETLRSLGEIETNGKLANVLLLVKNPFDLEKGGKKLLLDEFVRVEIEGKILNNAIKVPRFAYRNNKEIWLLLENKTLKRLEIKPNWEENDWLYFNFEVPKSAKLITSDLTYPVNGMQLNIFNSKIEKNKEAK